MLAEIPTYGVGPHEILALPDGHTLAIANGGLVTDLADGKQRRRDLNIPEMDPSLVFVDVRDGRLLEQARPDDHFASVRHLALAPDGTVAVAMQYEGPETNPYPVLGLHRGGRPSRASRHRASCVCGCSARGERVRRADGGRRGDLPTRGHGCALLDRER